MKTRPTITFLFIKNRRAAPGPLAADTPGYLHCRLTVSGAKREFATGIQLTYGEWNIDAHRLRGKGTAAKQANEALVKLEDALNDYAADLHRQGRPVTAHAILALHQRGGCALTLAGLYEAFLAERKQLVGLEISPGTYTALAVRRGILAAYLAASRQPELRPEEFRHTAADKMLHWMLTARGYGRNYANKVLQSLIQCLRWGLRRELLDKNPLAEYQFKMAATAEIKYLGAGELADLTQLVLPTATLTRARDCFVFQCWTGLAYADLAALNVARDAHYYPDGRGGLRRVLRVTRQKSTMQKGFECVIPLLPEAERLLALYADALPVVSNQVYNRQLKEVGALAELPADKMTTHVGRKTAGVLMLNAGIRMETVSKFLGHSSVKMTEKVYAKILDTTVVDDFGRLFDAPAPVAALPPTALAVLALPVAEPDTDASRWRRPPPTTALRAA